MPAKPQREGKRIALAAYGEKELKKKRAFRTGVAKFQSKLWAEFQKRGS